MSLYAAKLVLQPSAVIRLQLRDLYSIHRVVMDLFDASRTTEEQHASVSSGIQWVDRGEHVYGREIQILSVIPPRDLNFPNDVAFAWRAVPSGYLEHRFYRFSIIANPCRISQRRRIALLDESAIVEWFLDKAHKGGFAVQSMDVSQIKVCRFNKGKNPVSFAHAKITGVLEVTDPSVFQETVRKGIGKGRAFGFGLLQLVVM